MSSYLPSFGAALLRPDLCRIVAEHYLEAGDWMTARARILATNALQFSAPRAAERVEGELRRRLRHLTDRQIHVLAHATAGDRTAIAWLSVLKDSAFVFDFVANVLRDKVASLDPVLRPSDYEAHFEQAALCHPELRHLTPRARVKARQAILRMLREAGVVQKADDLNLMAPVLSPDVRRVIVDDNARWLAGFLIPDSELGSA